MYPVISIMQQAHLAASREDWNEPLPGRGLTYEGLVMEPLGRLLFSIANEPLITYGQWEETLLALRIFVGTYEPVEFGFLVAMDTGVGQSVSRIASGVLRAFTGMPNAAIARGLDGRYASAPRKTRFSSATVR